MKPRDWAWPWTRAWGPLTLRVRLDATLEVIERQVGGLHPNPYALEREGRYRSQPGVDRGELLLIAPGSIRLLRSFHEPPPRVLAFDARLLSALTMLGSLTWDLIDEEYFEPLGGGDDAASLVRHLSWAHEEDALRAEYTRRFTPLVCDASHAKNIDELFDALSIALGAPRPLRGEAFSSWFATAPRLPLRLSIAVDPSVGTEWQRVLFAARPGLLLTIEERAPRG